MDIFEALNDIQKEIVIVWPVHPRSKKMLKRFRFNGYISRMTNFKMVPAMGYLDFLKLMSGSKFVLTDSGGIQEETTALGIQCLTLRKNTERPVTVKKGTNIIVGRNKAKIDKEGLRIISDKVKKGKRPRYWDGKAAKRIVKILIKELEKRHGTR